MSPGGSQACRQYLGYPLQASLFVNSLTSALHYVVGVLRCIHGKKQLDITDDGTLQF